MANQSQCLAIAEQASDENGNIHSQDPSIEESVDINIREDSLRMFEDSEGRFYLTVPDKTGAIELVPGVDGIQAEPVVGLETSELSELEPAEPMESPDVEQSVRTEQYD